MVPIKEMTDVLKVVKEVTNLKPKSWVRLKRGLYKDDIAQVGCLSLPCLYFFHALKEKGCLHHQVNLTGKLFLSMLFLAEHNEVYVLG